MDTSTDPETTDEASVHQHLQPLKPLTRPVYMDTSTDPETSDQAVAHTPTDPEAARTVSESSSSPPVL